MIQSYADGPSSSMSAVSNQSLECPHKRMKVEDATHHVAAGIKGYRFVYARASSATMHAVCDPGSCTPNTASCSA